MSYEGYKSKDSLVIVYTGEGKGKTSASLGLLARALGTGKTVAYIQFIKHWDVGEHQFFADIQAVYPESLTFHKGGKGFYKAGEHSARGVSEDEHKHAASQTLSFAKKVTSSGEFDIVICDEINNAIKEKLISKVQVTKLIDNKSSKTTLCLTGRDFPEDLLIKVDIATNMMKIKHHFDDKYLANKGVDY